MSFSISRTESICPICLKKIAARRVYANGETRLEKTCAEHGSFATPIWREENAISPQYPTWLRPKTPSTPPCTLTTPHIGCPYDCGLCTNHRQHTCTALIEVTWRCNLQCPVCFASEHTGTAQNEKNIKIQTTTSFSLSSQALTPQPAKNISPPSLYRQSDPSLEEVTDILHSTLHTTGGCNLQLSGGEPTVRDDLPQIIRIAKQCGFPFVQVNTNGIRFAQEETYAETLAEAGLDSVFLQFDGLRSSTWQALRGKSLLKEKILAIKRLAKAGIGIVLVPTIVPEVNSDEIGEIIRFAIEHAPFVRGVHFQPVSYFGAYPHQPENSNRITLPEIMTKLEQQTKGLVQAGDFLPPGCEHSLCSFHANYIIHENGTLQRISIPKASCECSSIKAAEGASKAKNFVREQWAAPKFSVQDQKKQDAHRTDNSKKHPPSHEISDELDELDRFILRAKTHRFAISGMAFQDAWTLDIERLQGCCIHVVAPDGKLIPFCAYNITAMDGTPLHRTPQVHARNKFVS